MQLHCWQKSPFFHSFLTQNNFLQSCFYFFILRVLSMRHSQRDGFLVFCRQVTSWLLVALPIARFRYTMLSSFICPNSLSVAFTKSWIVIPIPMVTHLTTRDNEAPGSCMAVTIILWFSTAVFVALGLILSWHMANSNFILGCLSGLVWCRLHIMRYMWGISAWSGSCLVLWN